MENLLYTIMWALIWFWWTYFVYYLEEKSKEKNKIIYYYAILNDPSTRVKPFELWEIKTIIYKKTKDKKYLSDDFISNWKIKKKLEKYL